LPSIIDFSSADVIQLVIVVFFGLFA